MSFLIGSSTDPSSGKGAPVLGKKGKRGDQYVIVKIVPPRHLTADGQKAFEQMAKQYPYEPREE